MRCVNLQGTPKKETNSKRILVLTHIQPLYPTKAKPPRTNTELFFYYKSR